MLLTEEILVPGPYKAALGIRIGTLCHDRLDALAQDRGIAMQTLLRQLILQDIAEVALLPDGLGDRHLLLYPRTKITREGMENVNVRLTEVQRAATLVRCAGIGLPVGAYAAILVERAFANTRAR